MRNRCYNLILAVFFALLSATSGSEADVGTDADVEIVVVTATRTAQSLLGVPASTHVLSEELLAAQRQVRSVPEALRDIPGIMVQKTGHGQGSPYLRGFTGFRTLFLIDGIRLNNSVFREGPNQYWATVDPLSVHRLEAVMGPAAVQFGSDAIGGTVQALTNDTLTGAGIGHRLYYRYGSGENAAMLRGELSLRDDDRLGLRLGLSYKDFGDLEGGRDVGLQQKSGYRENDADLRADWRTKRGDRVTFLHQRAALKDAWRTHPTIYGVEGWAGLVHGSEQKRVLDQDRTLRYLQWHSANAPGPLDEVTASLSVHDQKESRDRVRADGRQDLILLDVRTTGYWVQASKNTIAGLLTGGLEYYHDDVGSAGRDFAADGSLTRVRTQGAVADDAWYDTVAVFIQDQWSVTDNLKVTAGARLTRVTADAPAVAQPGTTATFSLHESFEDTTASARFSWQPTQTEGLTIYGGIAQGFRAPNLSDLTRFDVARSGEIETPVSTLDPEQFVSTELGLRRQHGPWYLQAAAFHTDIRSQIVPVPTGNIVDGALEVTKANSGAGFIKGLDLYLEWQFAPAWSLRSGYAWLDGELETFAVAGATAVSEPVDRLMPRTAQLSVRWRGQNAWMELALQNAAKAHRLSTRDQRDVQRIPPGGTPGYTVWHLRSAWQLRNNLSLSVAIENIWDRDYRVHGSGLNEAGRNLLLTMDWRR